MYHKFLRSFVRVLKKKIEISYFLKFISTILVIFMLFVIYKKGIVAPLFINGEPVSFSEILKVLTDKEEGNFLDRLIAQKVLEYEAKKRNIVVKTEEVQSEILRIEKEAVENGKTLLQILKEKDQTLADLEKNVRTRILIYKIVEDEVGVSEEEIDEYINQHKELTGDRYSEEVRQEVKRLLLDKKVSEFYRNWIKDTKAKTKVRYIIDY